MVKIRLQRKGRKKQPFYHIVIADARSPRDGRFIEKIGFYNPMTVPATIELDRDKAYDWLTKGAQPTDTARAILRFKGVLYRKHLMRGVKKGALAEEKAMELYNDFVEAKDERIAKRFEEEAEKRLARLAEISGVAPPPPKVEEVVETVEVPAEAAEEAGDAVAAETVEVPAEAAEAAEEVAKTVEVPAEAVEEVKEEVAKTVEVPAEAVEEAKEEVAKTAEEVKEAAGDAVEKADDAADA